MATKEARLTHGSVGRHLAGMALPVLVGIATMMVQAFVDMWFIGRVGDRELAALGFAFPVLMVVTSVSIGLGAGTSSVVARAIGADDHVRVQRLATDSLLLSFFVTAAVSAIGIAAIDPLFRLLGAPEPMLPLIGGYMKIFYVAVPFVVVGMVGMSSMRATGDTRFPSLLMIIASIANVILDPILIFGLGPVPRMELNGAAMAALTARSALFVGALWFLRRRLDMLSFSRPDPAELRRSWADILHVGIPAAGTNAIVPIATGIITAMLAQYGPKAVAGFGVASRVEAVTLVMFYALSAIIGPFVGQNVSAGKAGRIRRALNLCTFFCLGSGLVIALGLTAASTFLPSLFSDDATVQGVAKTFLLIAPIGYGAYGMVMVMNASFNGMGRPLPGVVISVARTIVIYVPLGFLLDRFFGYPGIFTAYAVANLLTGLSSYVWARSAVQAQCDRHRIPLMAAG
ncbi:MAG TPA: MATE family efflux transporter [Woeseiaceae bacterium]|jgi:putative MATE family efflux protein|nr:MATE family efflux transporter [Woeseiaceae bacterium]